MKRVNGYHSVEARLPTDGQCCEVMTRVDTYRPVWYYASERRWYGHESVPAHTGSPFDFGLKGADAMTAYALKRSKAWIGPWNDPEGGEGCATHWRPWEGKK
jgi:hypothetical protein